MHELKDKIKDSLNEDINKRNKLVSKYSAYFNVHFPTDFNLQEKAIFRLKFEEIFFNQLIFQLKKNKIKSKKSFFFPITACGSIAAIMAQLRSFKAVSLPEWEF